MEMRSHPQCGMVFSGGGLWPKELTAEFGAQAGGSGVRLWLVVTFSNTLKKERFVRKERKVHGMSWVQAAVGLGPLWRSGRDCEGRTG